MKKALVVLDKVVWTVEDVVSIASLAGIVGIAFVNVIARYVFKSGFLWADEVSQALLVMMGMFGCARAVRANGHTQFDVLESKPKKKAVRVTMRAVILVITIIFLVFLLINSAKYTAAGKMLSTVLRVPRKYYYASIPIGFALCIYEYLRAIKEKVIDDPKSDE